MSEDAAPKTGSTADLAYRVGSLEGQVGGLKIDVGGLKTDVGDLKVSVAGVAGSQASLLNLISTQHGQAMGAIGALTATIEADRKAGAEMIAEPDKSPAGRALLAAINEIKGPVKAMEKRYWIATGVTIGSIIAAPAVHDLLTAMVAAFQR